MFVCGPFGQGDNETDFLGRFHNCRLIGLNLSMLEPLEQWNPFDLLLERNSSSTVRPDVVFLSKEPHLPVVGICRVEPYAGAWDHVANEAIDRLVRSNKMAVVNIDTRLDDNTTNLRTPAEVESLIARMDLLITTRLHGAVIAIKNGVPVIAIDPEAGGAKIADQMKKIGWPIILSADTLPDEALQKGFDYCLTEEAKKGAYDCYLYASDTIRKNLEEFFAEMTTQKKVDNTYLARLNDPASVNWILKRMALREEMELMKKAALRPPRFTLRYAVKKLLGTIAFWTLPAPILNYTKRIVQPRHQNK